MKSIGEFEKIYFISLFNRSKKVFCIPFLVLHSKMTLQLKSILDQFGDGIY